MTSQDCAHVRENMVSPSLQRSDGLLLVDASWTLAQAARYCREQQWIFPLARPLPAMQLREACRVYPIFADAFVAQITGDVAGESLATPSAPRAAMGPDLVGGVMTELPLFQTRAMYIRVFDAARTRIRRENFDSTLSASEAMVREMLEGRAFAIDAFFEQGTVQMSVLEAASFSEQIPAAPKTAFVSSLRIRPRQGKSLFPSDVSAISEALQNQARVVAAPFMGRVGQLNADGSNRVGDKGAEPKDAYAAFAQRLVRPSKPRGGTHDG